MSEKWRVRNMKSYWKMEVKKIVPQKLWCDPVQEFPLETKHQFEAVKMYLIIDPDGHEAGIVICPTHKLPIPVEATRRPLPSGDGNPVHA